MWTPSVSPYWVALIASISSSARSAAIAHDVQHGPEHLARELGRARELDERRCEEAAAFVRRAEVAAMQHRVATLCDVLREHRVRILVDHGADVGCEHCRIADHELVHPAGQEPQHVVRGVFLQAQEPQRRAPLSRAIESGLRRVAHDLLGQRGAVDDHRVDTASLCDQCRDRPRAVRELRVDRLSRFHGAREHDARDARIAEQRIAERSAVARQKLQGAIRHAGALEQAHGVRRDQRALLRRFGDCGVPGDERRGDLAAEDRQREVPRAYADEHSAS